MTRFWLDMAGASSSIFAGFSRATMTSHVNNRNRNQIDNVPGFFEVVWFETLSFGLDFKLDVLVCELEVARR